MEVGHQEKSNGIIFKPRSSTVMKKEMPLDCKVYAVMVEIFTRAITHAHLWPGFNSWLGQPLHESSRSKLSQ